MLKRRSKAISLVVALMFCLSFIAPAFVTPDAAQASSTYEVLQAPTVKTSSEAQNLGVVKVTLSDTTLAAYDILTVSLPSDIEVTEKTVKVTDSLDSSYEGIQIVANNNGDCLPVTAFNADPITIKGNNNFDIVMNDKIVANGTADQFFYIYFYGIDLNNTTGDIEVDFDAPSNSSFTSSKGIVIAKSSSSGSTTTSIKKVEDISDKGGFIDTITVAEDAPGSFDFNKDNGKFTLEILTKGFSWTTSGSGEPSATMEGEWAFSGTQDSSNITGNNDEKLVFALPDTMYDITYKDVEGKQVVDTKTLKKFSSPGKFTFNNLKIEADDSKATVGDEIEVKVKGCGMDKATIVVGRYVDYGVVVEEGTTKTLVAGQNKLETGEFYIKEGAAGSLLQNRIIKMTLPSGVEWNAKNAPDYELVGNGDITLDYKGISGDNDEIIKWEVTDDSDKDPVKIKFVDLKVNISPAFKGDLEIEVSGSAGAEGTVKVAEVVPAATISIDKVNNIVLGRANQKIEDITITESDVEAFLEGDLVLKLDRDYRFAKEPTVKVIEGDLDIDEDATIKDETLTIEVKTQSKKTASKILISDIYVDAYRTAPEGPISLEFGEYDNDGCDALNEVAKENDNDNGGFGKKSPGKAVVANCVTAALGETVGNGQFVIGSNIYEVNGVKKVMDVAPYIKGDRTYVPVRYLAYVLGLTEDDIVWDESNQKVTFTKGDNTVELVIGSTTITVNGEEQVMDVAPEISNDRTMLPARFVAEGFGFNVGWDAANRIVLISK